MTMKQTIFVTGGASGIGFAIVQATLAQGWQVVVADANQTHLDQARDKLTPHHALAHFELLDVTNEDAEKKAIERCEIEFGVLTGLVNSAGIGRDVHCLDTTTDLFRKIIEVNLIGSFVVSREAARRMRTRSQGSIVNIASVSGVRGNSGRVAYGASKAGVINMTQVMAVELASVGIRVNAIAPGPIETPLVLDMHTEQARAGWIPRRPTAPLRHSRRGGWRGDLPARRSPFELRDRPNHLRRRRLHGGGDDGVLSQYHSQKGKHMTTENFRKVLLAMIRRRPFKPFTVELNTGFRIEIDHPEATVIREGVAIFIGPGFVPVYFDHESVTQIIDSPAHAAS